MKRLLLAGALALSLCACQPNAPETAPPVAGAEEPTGWLEAGGAGETGVDTEGKMLAFSKRCEALTGVASGP